MGNGMPQEAIKKALGEQAAAIVQDGMLIGLGTGTTVKFLIDSLIKRCKQGLKISAVASSKRSMEQAQAGGIPILDMDRVSSLDMTLDGADEIDSQNRMIKGGGGALLREKILASSCKEMVIIVDESKLVANLGRFGVAIEIHPFCYLTTIGRMRQLGCDGKMRYNSDSTHYMTDNGNYIFDLHSPDSFPHPEETHNKLAALPGVMETGFFFNLPLRVLVGYKDGSVGPRKKSLEAHDG